ncbi:MAG: molybdopterin-dependent oxidoreductase [Candidatus Dojkabacteria bacterium]|nr:molybdopterin-dependent oxidoreductase [Candidatus Dojkabacteria bacterium]
MQTVLCPYCGCGCILHLDIDEKTGKPVATMPVKTDVVSRGMPCVKGLTVHEVLGSNRITRPMVRRRKDASLQTCTWEEAYSFIRAHVDEIAARHSGSLRDHMYFLGSGEASNEANYLLSKLARTHFGSNNIDSCARLCHASTGVVFKKAFGISAIPVHTMDDLERGDLFIFIGTDPLEDYPVLFHRVLNAKRKGAKIATVDVSHSGTRSQSDYVFSVSPHGIVPLISHLIVRLVDNGDISRDARYVEGFDGFLESARSISHKNPPSVFGLTPQDMDNFYRLIRDAKVPVIGYGMGLTQHQNSVDNVASVTGLSMLLDAVLFPNRGKVNVQGAGDVGAQPDWETTTKAIAHGWNDAYRSHEGLPSTEGLYRDEVEFVWVMGSNPCQSMPDLNALEGSFRRKFVVYQHHHPGRTMEFADVVLPMAVLSEEQGSITNGERRVRGFFNETSGLDNSGITIGDNIRTGVRILVDWAKSLGASGFDFDSDRQVFEEMVQVVPGYGRLTGDGVRSAEGQFADKEIISKRLVSFDYPDEHFTPGGFPFRFTTARTMFHFCTGLTSRSSRTLNGLGGSPYVLVNPMDAQALGLSDSDRVRITSSVGSIEALVKVHADVGKRIIVAPLHFEKLLVNYLTPRVLDPESATPCFKDIGVSVEKC